MQRLLLILLFIWYNPLFSQYRGKILKGKFGNIEVVLKLEYNKDKIFGEYLIQDNGKGIHLSGGIKNDYITLKSERYIYSNEVKKEFYEYLSFCQYDEGAYSGEWKRGNEIEIVWLQEVDLRKQSPYEYFDNYRINLSKNVLVTKIDTININGFPAVNHSFNPDNIKGYRHAYEAIVFPRIIEHPRKEIVNSILDSIHRDYMYLYMACSPYINESDYYVNLSHIYLDNFNLSLLITGEKCCGQRCNYPQTTYNINLINGQEIMIHDLFATTTDSISNILLNKFKVLYPSEFNREDDTNCNLKNIENWEYPNWTINKEGINVLSNSTYAYRGPCVEYWFFPNKVIKRDKMKY